MAEKCGHRLLGIGNIIRRMIAIGMSLCLVLLAGCSAVENPAPVIPSSIPEERPAPEAVQIPEDTSIAEGYQRGRDPVHFSQMTYVRPDLQEMRREVREQVAIIRRGESLEQTFEAMLAAGRILDHFDTMYTLSDIHSDADLSDSYWMGEWRFCNDGYRVYGSLWSDVYAAIERSGYAEQLLPLWDKAMDNPEPESLDYRRSDALQDHIDAIADEALDIIDYATVQFGGQELTLDEAYDHPDWVNATGAWCAAYGPELLELYTRMASAGGELARECYGYDDYASYLFDMYSRDYTPRMALALTDDIIAYMVALDDDLLDQGYWGKLYDEYQDFDDLMETARAVLEGMGGEMTDALDLLLDYGLYYIDEGDYQYGRAYVIHLAAPNVPFLYCPFDGTFRSAADFTHEFGHFYEIYLTMEDYCIPDDLSEVHSQAMALLFAQALADQTGDDALLEGVLTDTVDTLVGQSFNAAIELRVFALDPQSLTAEAVGRIGREQSARFGYWQRDQMMAQYMWLTDTELFTAPLQPLCYAVSGGAALELWRLSLEDMEAALNKYDKLTRHPHSHRFLYNLDAVDMAGPFGPGWAEETEAFLRGRIGDGALMEAA